MDESELAMLVTAGEQMCVLSFLIFFREVSGSIDLSRHTIKVPLLDLSHRELDSCAAS